MRFLFIGQGYPNVPGTTSGSGIGTYLREITLGLVERGHECHVVVWQVEGEGRKTEGERERGPATVVPSLSTARSLRATANCSLFTVNSGIHVFRLPHAYWPLVERVLPDSRDEWNVRRLVRQLDALYHYDRIEIQSEEGIGIGVQRDFPERAILRIHTTLQHMVEIKGAGGRGKVEGGEVEAEGEHAASGPRVRAPSFLPPPPSTLHPLLHPALPWKTRYRLWRERRSFHLASRIITHSRMHAEELTLRFPGIAAPAVVWHGIGGTEVSEQWAVNCEQSVKDGASPSSLSTVHSATAVTSAKAGPPSFLLVGSLDRRKGFDRLRPILDAYVAAHGPCRAVLVISGSRAMQDALGLGRDEPGAADPGWTVEWRHDLDDAGMAAEYTRADVYLHLARYESFGLPLIEAAAAGVPVVSTRVGVAPELLDGAMSAYLIDADDAAGTANALHQAVTHRESAGAEIRARHGARFVRAVMTERWLTVSA